MLGGLSPRNRKLINTQNGWEEQLLRTGLMLFALETAC
jgi:hypothetical protein